MPFLELIHWLKYARSSVYQNMIDRYKANAQNLYEKDFINFFKCLSHRIEIDKSNFFCYKKKSFCLFFVDSKTNNELLINKYYTGVKFFF